MNRPDLDRLRSEGELNIWPRGQAWRQEHVDETTKHWLEVVTQARSSMCSAAALPLVEEHSEESVVVLCCCPSARQTRALRTVSMLMNIRDGRDGSDRNPIPA